MSLEHQQQPRLNEETDPTSCDPVTKLSSPNRSLLRIIARLDVKGANLIKGMHLEGLRVVGDPQEFAQQYYQQGIDEIVYIDTVASLYGRNNLVEIVRRTAESIFVPITVGGGIRSVDDVRVLLRAGADKVAINTAATENPALIEEVARSYGSQCVVLSIEAKRRRDGWEALVNNGRDRTGRSVVEWAIEGVQRGAGEILLTSVDQEGTRKGFDVELTRAVATSVPVPVIASGGLGKAGDLVAVFQEGCADAVAIADALHYGRCNLSELRETARGAGLRVRTP